jgi:hypothetical protein
MRFLSRKPPARSLSPARTPHPWDPPQTEFPAIVPINTLQFGRSGDAAAAITGISAYSSGFEVFVTRLIRPGAPGIDDPAPGTPRAGLTAREPFQISVQLSDGSHVISSRPQGDSEPAGPILRPRGGGGTLHYQLLQWWAWPLPPSGPLEFICHWPALGPGDTRVRIDARVILDAAQRSIRLWPESHA